MEKFELSVEEAVDFLKENLEIHDTLEIAYNRVFAEGEVLNIDFSKYFGEPGFKILVSLDADSINPTIEIDVYEIADDLIEYTIYHRNGEELYVSVVDK
ncbi:MAG: DUF2097 family protein [Methanobrevibacter sp.]|uniref:DUF2097 family protein n=1 Tax=Methanobrevibacter sp. TaxID=66852 RepID=UPI0026E0CAF8|nr:DUF2097 family protein [Methanobrevibacter sp.]MDO5848562.1 DUF2097 family protein [Methanobrevibacter sp.]